MYTVHVGTLYLCVCLLIDQLQNIISALEEKLIQPACCSHAVMTALSGFNCAQT